MLHDKVSIAKLETGHKRAVGEHAPVTQHHSMDVSQDIARELFHTPEMALQHLLRLLTRQPHLVKHLFGFTQRAKFIEIETAGLRLRGRAGFLPTEKGAEKTLQGQIDAPE